MDAYNATDVQSLRSQFLELLSKKEYVRTACEAKRSLDMCIVDPGARECFNVPSFMNFTFVHNETDARFILSNYLQLHYACADDIFDSKFPPLCYSLWIHLISLVAYANYDCILEATAFCQSKQSNSSCLLAKAWVDCAVTNATGTCGKAPGCFTKKFMNLDICGYDLGDACGICGSLTVLPNPVNNLCDDDIKGPVIVINSSNIPGTNSGLLITIFAALLFAPFFSNFF